MADINTVAWVSVFVLVFVSQALDAFLFNNTLQHLTNWAWVFHGIVAATRAFQKSPRILSLIAFSLAVFVAAGIAGIQIADNGMIKAFEKKEGVALVTSANILFHYIPPVAWLIVLLYESEKNYKWYSETPQPAASTQPTLVPLAITAFYALLFNVKHQYPGAKLNFLIIFSAASAITVGCTFAILLIAYARSN